MSPVLAPRRIGAATCLILVALVVCVPDAPALVHFDFEQAYHVHPGRQTWDFSVVRDDSLYHLYYHTIPIATPHSAYADTIWHAVGPDLSHWTIVGPVILSGTASWDTAAVWAPDVFRDEASSRWAMAYTGAGPGMNQRIGFAFSEDLDSWTQAANPVVEPDTNLYIWHPEGSWSDFRDPYVYRENEQWHLLVTAAQWRGKSTGVLYHAVSDDLATWLDVGPLFVNDGDDPWRVLESSQYHVMEGHHHLFFGEFDTMGISHVSAPDTASLTMASRTIIDAGGYAPEVDEFDPGIRIISRIAPIPLSTGGLQYVIRFDTLLVATDGTVVVHRPHPLDADWERTGLATAANPTFGDNPARRGEDPVNLVGNGYFGSGEYYQGPLSSYPAPGAYLGGTATGELRSRPFTVTGDRMTLLVGGPDKPDSLYAALVDAASDSVLRLATGDGPPAMTPREWSLAGLQGRSCRIVIVDLSSATGDAINVDEIVEIDDPVVATVPADGRLAARAVPNPANPRTEVRCDLDRPAAVSLSVHDARGRTVWRGPVTAAAAGPVVLPWPGCDVAGRQVSSGVYFYRVLVDGRTAAAGKLALVR